MERRLAAILAADVVGYSRLMGADEAGTLAALKAVKAELIDGAISEHDGRTVKLTGDGMLVEFASVVSAVACAVADNVEAYTYYLRGRDFLHRRSKHYVRIARQMFAKAVDLDPKYARAYAGMVDCDSFVYLSYRGNVPIDDLLATAEKALSLDDTLAEAHASRGISARCRTALRRSRNRIREGNCARSKFVRGTVLLCSQELRWGKLGTGRQPFRARLRDQAGRLSVCVSAH